MAENQGAVDFQERASAKRAKLWDEACRAYGRQPTADEWTRWLEINDLAGPDELPDGPGAA